MALTTLLPLGPVVAQGWTLAPQRTVSAALTFIGLRLDRTSLVPAASGDLCELEMLMSVDDGVTWGGTVTVGSVQYPLQVRATVPDGAVLDRNGLAVPFSQVGVVLAPTGATKLLRASYRVVAAATFAVILETR